VHPELQLNHLREVPMSNSFTPKLGRIGWKQGARLDRYVNQVMRAAHSAGYQSGGKKSSFTGKRLGRGNAFGTLAAAGFYPGGQRRAIVKARISKLKVGYLGAARAHLRYIQRDGVTPEGEPGQLYGPETDEANGTAFLDNCEGDRHQFRLIVSCDDGAELVELKPFIRDFMAKVESDLETKLDWVAVDHYNTGHPHTHIIIRGKDDLGRDLIMTKDYVSHGLRMRARELLTMELGPEEEGSMVFKIAREADADRFTRLDRALLQHTDGGYLVVSAMPPEDRATHASHMGRLKKLQNLGLALERQTGVWQISPDVETKLKSLGQRGDIIKTMHRVMRETGIDRPGGSFAMFDTAKPNNRIVGRVAGLGLTDEINDRHYIVIDGTDGKVHYADVGHLRPEFVPDKGMIVAIENKAADDSEKHRTRLRILSYLNLEKLVEAEGATWLDRELLGRSKETLAQTGFGDEVASAIIRRRQWLVAQGLGTINTAHTFQPQPRIVEHLRHREIQQASAILSRELGFTQANPIEGERISGIFSRSVHLASGKYAVIQKSKEFTLVPWRPELEQFRGKALSGTASSQGINWDWNMKRGQGLGIS
jgi:type IV secretory pathway VirD2 relaxase